MRKYFVVLLAIGVVAALMLGLLGCGSRRNTTVSPATTAASATTAKAQTCTVSAASSLKGAFTEIGKAFDAANNCKTAFNFDASGTLQKQIEGGAPVDVFASAAMKQVTALTGAAGRRLQRQKVRRKPDGFGRPRELDPWADRLSGPRKSRRGQDYLRRPRELLPRAWQPSRFLPSSGSEHPEVQDCPRQNASQAVTYVISGDVDAGIIYASEAKAAGDKLKVIPRPIKAGTRRLSTPRFRDFGE